MSVSKTLTVLSKRFQISIIIIILIGVLLRFYNLDKKYYWQDESVTSLRISGYTFKELKEEVLKDKPVSIAQFKKTLLDSNKNVPDMINGLAEENSDNLPLYFILLRFWTDLVGESITTVRGFSAVLSVLALPCLYWLCLELFESSVTGIIAVMLMSVSPFHLLYAQEARMYSAWALLVLLSSITLLRAIKFNNTRKWLEYALTACLGMATHLFMALVLLQNMIYLVILEKFKWSKVIRNGLIASLAGLTTLVLWILLAKSKIQIVKEVANYWIWDINKNVGFGEKLAIFFNQLDTLFVDFWYRKINLFGLESNSWIIKLHFYLKPLIVILLGYAIFFIVLKAPLRASLFVSMLILTVPVGLGLVDLTTGSGFLKISRYLFPSYIGLGIVTAYLLSSKIVNESINSWSRRFWKLVTVLLISGGFLSCLLISQAETWQTKYGEFNLKNVAVLNEIKQPLLIIGDTKVLNNLLSLSNYLNDQVQVIYSPQTKDIDQVIEPFNDVFVLYPSAEYGQQVQDEQKYSLVQMQQAKGLWRLERKTGVY